MKDKIDDFLDSLQDSTDKNKLEQDIRIEKMIRDMFDAEIKREVEKRRNIHQYIAWYATIILGAATLFTKVMGWW